jgi:purine-binding chemotaxis protein CheW
MSNAAAAAADADLDERQDTRRVLIFRSGTERLSLAAHEVVEVVRPPRIARVPHAPPGVCGVANLRGAVLPILSLAILLGRTQSPATGTTRVLVLNSGTPSACWSMRFRL